MSDLTMSMFLRKEGFAEARGWQPISTAPLDGTEILAFSDFGDTNLMQVVYWDGTDDSWWVVDAQCGRHFNTFSHWQPLPEPPQ